MKDPYYSRSEVSNSDLSALKKELFGGIEFDPTKAYLFGTLIDCMITEPHKVNYSLLQCSGEQYEEEDFERASVMRRAFFKDPFLVELLKNSIPQSVMVNQNQKYSFDRLNFTMPSRCKWDFWTTFGWGADLKSTTATTQKQFEDAVRHFDYDRQRAFYMNMAGSKQDMLIGISKVNFKVFKVPIKYGDELHQSGVKKMSFLAYKYWQLLI